MFLSFSWSWVRMQPHAPLYILGVGVLLQKSKHEVVSILDFYLLVVDLCGKLFFIPTIIGSIGWVLSLDVIIALQL